MMINHGDLATLLQKHPEQWKVVMRNVVYILQEVLKGLVYLDSENIQHSDIKGIAIKSFHPTLNVALFLPM